MANTTLMPTMKIDPVVHYIGDLPAEIRIAIYKSYFQLPGPLSIHLINLLFIPVAKTSSVHHAELPDTHDSTRELCEIATAAALGLRTAILRTSHAISTEARPFLRGLGHFRIVGGFYLNQYMYHARLRVIPPAVLSNIRSLQFDRNIIDFGGVFDPTASHWSAKENVGVVARMAALESLHVIKLGPQAIYNTLETLTSGVTLLLNASMKILVRFVIKETQYAPIGRHDVRLVPTSLRLPFPALDELLLEAEVSQQALDWLVNTKFNGSQRQLRVPPTSENALTYDLLQAPPAALALAPSDDG